MRCSFFARTVVLLVEHSDEGSFGFVVNKPAEGVAFAKILRDMGLSMSDELDVDAPVLIGGPVSPETGWVVFDPSGGEKPEDTVRIGESIAVTASFRMLELLADGRGPERRLMVLGYAGWGPGQLENEMREGSWIPVDRESGLLYETPMEERWRAALGTLGIDPARMVGFGVASA